MAALTGSAARRLDEATAHHRAGRLAEALAIYLDLAARHPARAELRYRAGVALMALRRFDEAAAQLAESARLEPGQPAAWLSLGLARREMLDAEGAAEALAKARALDPSIPQVNGQLGLVLRDLGRLDEALERVAEEARRFPAVPRNHNNLGTTLLALGREREAEAAFLEAVRIDRDYGLAYANLAGSLQKRGELAGAEAAWREVVRLSPKDTRARDVSVLISGTIGLLSLVAAVIFLVSASNIAYTFRVLVTERRGEIALYRAVGASGGDMRSWMLALALVVGVSGGIVGLCVARLLAFGADALAARRLPDFPFKPETFFAFPWWLPLAAVGFASLFALLGAWGPARRAAKLSPAHALAGSQ